MNPLRGAVAALLLLGASQEPGRNPDYEAWCNFPVGATVRHRFESELAGARGTSELRSTLKSAAKTDLRIERETVSLLLGRRISQPVILEKLPERQWGSPPPGGLVEESDEEIGVAGRRIKCRRTTRVLEAGGVTLTTREWTSAEVPGGLVRRERRFVGAAPASETLELTGWELPK